MRQLTLLDFRPRAIPCTSWMHEHDGRGWIYRSNAEAVVHDLNAMPSGMGIWPRMMGCRGRHRCDGWDVMHFQCRGCGKIEKLIRLDGVAADFIRPNRYEVVNGQPTPESELKLRISSAYIDGDELMLETEDGRLWSEIIIPDSECHPRDVWRYDPENDPEHFLIACLHAGCTGEELYPIADLPYRFEVISPYIPEMDTVFELSKRIGISPRLKTTVRMSDEFQTIYYKRRTQQSIRRSKEVPA